MFSGQCVAGADLWISACVHTCTRLPSGSLHTWARLTSETVDACARLTWNTLQLARVGLNVVPPTQQRSVCPEYMCANVFFF